jgi:hypothetical protein
VCLRNFSTDLPICTIRQLRRLRYEMRLHGNVSLSCLCLRFSSSLHWLANQLINHREFTFICAYSFISFGL